MRPRTLVAGSFVAAILAPGVARAQDPEAAALFAAAKDLAAKGQWAEACPKFEAAQKKEPAIGTLMNLADCHEHTPLIFRAWGEWRLAYEQAQKASDTPRADLAKRRLDGIEPRLPKVKVTVTGMQSDLSVWRDDKQLDPAEYNTELPIDLGKHAITVRRGSATLESKSLESAEKAHDSVTFDLDKIAKDHPAPVETSSGGGTKGDGKVVQTNTVVVNQQTQSGTPALKVVGNIFLGVGLTSLVLGGAFEGVALAIKGSVDCGKNPYAATPPNLCSPNAISSITTAATLADVGLIMMIAGGTLAATGIVFAIVAPKEHKEQAPSVGFAPLPGGGMLSFGRSF